MLFAAFHVACNRHCVCTIDVKMREQVILLNRALASVPLSYRLIMIIPLRPVNEPDIALES